MNNFFLLTKVFFLNNFTVNKKKQKSSYSGFLTLSLIILGVSTYYSFSIFSAGMSYLDAIIMIFAAATMLTLILSLTKMQGTIFNTNDFEFLESLPLSKRCVVGAKIFSTFLYNAFEDLCILLPGIVMYYVRSNDLYASIMLFISGLFICLIPLLVSSLIGSLIAIITKNLKNKTLFTTIIYFVFIIVVFVFSFTMNNSSVIEASRIATFLPQLYLVINALEPAGFINLIYFILINLGCFGLVILLISKLYRKINLMHNKSSDTSDYVKENKKENLSVAKTLEKKEIKMILGNSNWLINSFVGPVFFLIIGIVTLFMNYAPEETVQVQGEIRGVMGGIVAGMSIMMNTTSTSTVAAYSLENKNFEFLLSYPIDPKEYIKAKIKAAIKINFIMNIVTTSIVVLIHSLVRRFDIWFVLQVMIIPHFAYVFMALIGTLCGLRWPKLDYDNDMQVIKQGTAMGLSMLFAFLPGMLLTGLIAACDIIPIYMPSLSFLKPLGFILVIVIFTIAILILRSAIKKNGTRLFRKVIER